MCQEILDKDISNAEGKSDFIVSTETIIGWIDICISALEQDPSVEFDDLTVQAGLVKEFFSEFGENEFGENLLFAKLLSEEEVRRLLQRSDCSKNLENSIVNLYNSCFDSSKDSGNALDDIRTLPASTQRDVFLDVYDHSSNFWNDYFSDNDFKGMHIPFGMDITEWMIVMDAIGSTAGIWGGPAGASLIGAAFSIGAKREYERNS